jgi:hypothetical protein
MPVAGIEVVRDGVSVGSGVRIAGAYCSAVADNRFLPAGWEPGKGGR